MAAMATKLLGYGVRVNIDLRAAVILVNTEWVAQQTWGGGDQHHTPQDCRKL